MYGYAVRYDPEAFDEVPVTAFRKALGAELNTKVGGIYDPLPHSPLYQPQTKRRHHLSEAYWQAINPARFDTPVAERAFSRESVLFSHPHRLASREAMQAIVAGVQKLHEERAELAAWALTEQGPDPIKTNTHHGARL